MSECTKVDYTIVFFSGGKDSTAMLLKMLELQEPVDDIIMFDTQKEFPKIYDHISRVEEYTGRKIHYLAAAHTFEEYMFDAEIKHTPAFIEKHGNTKGYGWPGTSSRWCNSKLKIDVKEKYINGLKKKHPDWHIVECIGIAADETDRIGKKTNMTDDVHNVRLPLVEYGMTEADCLKYCLDKGFDFGGLYNWSKRVSCWCCPLTSIEGWRGLYDNEPELWQQLLEMERKAWNTIKDRYSAFDLDLRFKLQDEWEAAGKPTNGKAFLYEYNKRRGHDDNGNPVDEDGKPLVRVEKNRTNEKPKAVRAEREPRKKVGDSNEPEDVPKQAVPTAGDNE